MFRNLSCLFLLMEVILLSSGNVFTNEVIGRDECTLSDKIIKEIAGYKTVANRIINEVVNGKYKGETWKWLAELVDKVGPRLAGSDALNSAVDHMVELSNNLTLENVHTEDVKIPHWIRGAESVWMETPRLANLAMLGLGGSVGTPTGGIRAQAVVVDSFEELDAIPASEIRGKIVVYNPEFISYGKTVQYRSRGASVASTRGAVAALVRSVTPESLRTPHTGAQSYDSEVKPIPVACITVEDAEMLSRIYKRGERITLFLNMSARIVPEGTTSQNTIVELQGHDKSAQRPVVIVSGHLDSWDVGDGAMDDGGGVMISLAAVAVLKQLGLRPRRTIRAIFWTAEEFGLIGAFAYKKSHEHEEDQINFLMESDGGTFKPLGLDFSGSQAASCIMQEVLQLLEPINATKFVTPMDGGPDISIWAEKGIPSSSLLNENERYFWYHHSAGDSMAVEDPDNLDLCTALWAVVSFVIADLEEPLPRM